MIAVIIFIHDLLFHAAIPERKSCPHASPGTPSPKPNINSFFFRALNDVRRARDANDVPGIDRAKQRGFGRCDATFGLKTAVKGAVSSARNTKLFTIYATAALLCISNNVLCVALAAATKSPCILRCTGQTASWRR
jgi:hypothetical protein